MEEFFHTKEAATRLSKALIWQAAHDIKISEAERIKKKMLKGEELTNAEKSTGAYFFIANYQMMTDSAWSLYHHIRKAIIGKDGFIDKNEFEKFKNRLTKMKKYVSGSIMVGG